MVRFRLRATLKRKYEKRWLERAKTAIGRWALDIYDSFEDAIDVYVEERRNVINNN
jgi:hypothetical protein